MTILSLIAKETPEEGQKYAHLENLFKQAISDGTLAPGEKLPPLRKAAWEAKCSLGTMSRVYSSLERKGLVFAEVGRGTFVQEVANLSADVILPRAPISTDKMKTPHAPVIDLGMNAIANDWGEELIRWALKRASDKASSFTLMTYRDGFGDREQKLALRPFLPSTFQSVGEERILITHGAQNGIFTALGRLTSPGDTVCLEPLSYPGVAAAINHAGLSSVTVDCDNKGICPISFEKQCKNGRIRALVTTATGHNPTCTTTPLERRKEIGVIALKYNVLIIEDDIYGFLYPDAPPPYAMIFPENAIYLTGLAKRITPSLRIGIVVAPPHIAMLMAQGITAQTWMVSPILISTAMEIASRKDDLHKYTQEVRRQAEERIALTKQIIGEKLQGLKTCNSHAWLKLPDNITAEAFARRSVQNGVHILTGTRFSNRSHAGDGKIRLSIMAPENISTLETALIKLRAILYTPNEKPYDFF